MCMQRQGTTHWQHIWSSFISKPTLRQTCEDSLIVLVTFLATWGGVTQLGQIEGLHSICQKMCLMAQESSQHLSMEEYCLNVKECCTIYILYTGGKAGYVISFKMVYCFASSLLAMVLCKLLTKGQVRVYFQLI